MKMFARGNLTTAVLLALTVGMSQPVFASEPIQEENGTKEVDLSDVSVSDTLSSVWAKDTGKIIATGSKNQNINLTDTFDKEVRNVYASNGGSIQLGDADTKSVTISSTGKNAYGIMSLKKGSNVTINGDTLTINAHGTDYAIGMQAQSNSETPATIDINTKNTIINASTDVDASTLKDGAENPAIGLISYSGSRVTIHNNLTVNAPTAISTRGGSTVTINPEGTGTVKLNGDISFNYD
ncbi:MAG: hypothetical protein PUG02_06905, partial [Selenomonadaceae bacterium]|nr:hypothetical protein [Selenomonadaceae bacterium]